MIIGIDLGTTNSVAAIWRDGAAHIIPGADNAPLTPSAVGLDDAGTLIVGAPARARRAAHPRDTATSFKRLMGTTAKTALGGTDYLPEELSALVLRHLKERAEAWLGEPVTGAVVTVPAYFNDRQRKATRRAGALAGLTIERLLNEPTAAALAYGIQDRAEREPFLVFDLGGGTFDVSIVEIYNGIVEVRASAGDSRLGGDDFSRLLVDLACSEIDRAGTLAGCDPIEADALLFAAAEQCRHRLTDADEAPYEVVAPNGASFETTITGTRFEDACKPLLDRLREPVLRSLRDSDTHVEALSEIVLVGGATRMPVVRRAITRMFRRFPSSVVDPDQAVALGAAVQAGLLMRDAALDEIRLTDICPFTLGVDHVERDARGGIHHGVFSPIIERNTPIPVSRSNIYQTVGDNQREVRFGVFQGESRDVANNILLGELRVPVPPRPAGAVQVECRFSYDSSGLLEVDVSVPATGLTRNLVILDGADDLSAADIAGRRAALTALKVHPREDPPNQIVLARAQRLYEGFIGESRNRIGQMITEFQAVLESQDLAAIAHARGAIGEALDRIESDDRW